MRYGKKLEAMSAALDAAHDGMRVLLVTPAGVYSIRRVDLTNGSTVKILAPGVRELVESSELICVDEQEDTDGE